MRVLVEEATFNSNLRPLGFRRSPFARASSYEDLCKRVEQGAFRFTAQLNFNLYSFPQGFHSNRMMPFLIYMFLNSSLPSNGCFLVTYAYGTARKRLIIMLCSRMIVLGQTNSSQLYYTSGLCHYVTGT